MKRIIIILLAVVIHFATAMAQNSIDDLVDKYSAISKSKYTSAVERNPRTRAVVKVVKVLEFEYGSVKPLVDAFRQESRQGNFSERKEGDDLIMTLTTREPARNRIYMLKVDDFYAYSTVRYNHLHCNVTIIVKYK